MRRACIIPQAAGRPNAVHHAVGSPLCYADTNDAFGDSRQVYIIFWSMHFADNSTTKTSPFCMAKVRRFWHQQNEPPLTPLEVAAALRDNRNTCGLVCGPEQGPGMPESSAEARFLPGANTILTLVHLPPGIWSNLIRVYRSPACYNYRE